MPKDPSAIIETTVMRHGLVINLENGVTIYINSNPNSINMHFSGIDHTPEGHYLVAGAFPNDPNIPDVKLSNYLDITYLPKEK